MIQYLHAVDPEKPLLNDPVVVGQSETHFQYLLEWSQPNNALSDLDHYELLLVGHESTDKFVSAQENKTVISIDVGTATNVTIVAVSGCGVKSLPDELYLWPAAAAKQHNNVYIISFALLSGLIIILSLIIVIIVLSFIVRKVSKVSVHSCMHVYVWAYLLICIHFVHACGVNYLHVDMDVSKVITLVHGKNYRLAIYSAICI